MTSKANFGTGKAHLLVCCFCGTPIEGMGANPDTSPVRWGKKLSPKRCCRRCDIERVIPTRMGLGRGALGTMEEWMAAPGRARGSGPRTSDSVKSGFRREGDPKESYSQ